MTVRDEVNTARERLVRAGVAPPEAGADAELLARHVLGWDRATYLSCSRNPVPARFDTRYAPLVARRARREPISLITEQREFWGLVFAVGPGMLIPRPESELIIEEALAVVRSRREAPIRIADIGTGSGCLAVSLAHELPNARVTAVEVSRRALAGARRNAVANGVAGRIDWVEASFSDWLVAPEALDAFDLIVANLPYIPTGEVATLAPEVRVYEPRIALDGGPDGLDPLRALLPLASRRMAPGAHLIVELGAGQAETLRGLIASTAGLALCGIRNDVQGIPRMATIAADVTR